MLKHLVIPTRKNNYTAHLIHRNAILFYIIVIVISNSLFSFLGLVRVSASISVQAILDGHNESRVENQLDTLKLHPLLNESAIKKGLLMLETDCWSHYCEGSPEGTAPWGFFEEVGYTYLHAGENLAEGFSGVDTMISAWLNSTTHRENMLNDDFTHIGIGIVNGSFQGKSNNTIVVIHFGSTNNPELNDISVSTQSFTTNTMYLEITNPENGEVLTGINPLIEGNKSKSIQFIDLFINNTLHGSISASGENFTFRPPSLEKDKAYIFKVEGKFTANENAVVQDEIKITIASNPPITSKQRIEMIFPESTTVIFSINLIKNYKDLLVSPPGTQISRLDNNTVTIETSIDKIINNDNIISFDFTSFDGETTNISYSTSDIELIRIQDNIYTNVSAYDTSFNILDSYIRWVSSLNMQVVVMIFFILFLIVLFVIDFYILRKHNILHKVERKSHLKLALFSIVFILLHVGGITGSIVNSGVSI